MKIYKVNDKYKSTQKTNGKIIPYEKIGKSLYKKPANCTSFLTSEKRIYYWIAAVADVLWTKGDNTLDINWRDRKEPNESISQTELIVSEKSENVTNNEEILYKVVFYLTTGKIMIQGKAWESFCDKHFNKCLQLVSDQ